MAVDIEPYVARISTSNPAGQVCTRVSWYTVHPVDVVKFRSGLPCQHNDTPMWRQRNFIGCHDPIRFDILEPDWSCLEYIGWSGSVSQVRKNALSVVVTGTVTVA